MKINKAMHLCAEEKKMCQGKFLPCDTSPQTTLSISCKHSLASTILKLHFPFFFSFYLVILQNLDVTSPFAGVSSVQREIPGYFLSYYLHLNISSRLNSLNIVHSFLKTFTGFSGQLLWFS